MFQNKKEIRKKKRWRKTDKETWGREKKRKEKH